MRRLDFGPSRATPITDFDSSGATAVPLGSGRGEAHVYAVRFEPGGRIGAHETGFGQLFLVVEGAGWVEGADGRRTELSTGEGAFFERGERHEKGSEVGMTALMVQLSDLAPDPGAVDPRSR